MNKLLAIALLILITSPIHAGMLTGQTPASYTVPSGWSLVTTDNFEGTNPAGTGQGWYDGVQDSTFSHSGTKSYKGTYVGDQSTVRWILGSSRLGTYSEVYVSFYEYIESNALFNDEFFLMRFSRSNPFHEVIMDWYWARNDAGVMSYNGTKATLYAVPQGVRFGNVAGITATVPKGAWVQWEIHYRPNSPGIADGFIRVYKDGTLFTQANNVNLNGTVAMSGYTGIQVAGVYTQLTWTSGYPNCPIPITTCTSAIGQGTDECYAQVYKNQLGANTFASPLCSPTQPSLPNFRRWMDDIIVMKTAAASGGDVSPPYTNTNSPAKNSTGWPVANRDISFYVRDDTNVTRSTISMSIDGATALTCASGLTCTPTTTPATSYLVSYTRGSDWTDNTTYSLNIRATDVYSNALNETYTFRTALAAPEALAITTTTLDNGTVGTSYSQTLAATGGVSPYTWDNTTPLPAGLSISPNTGAVVGVPTTAGGPTSVTFRVTDSASPAVTDTQDINITIDASETPGYPVGEIHAVGDTYFIKGSTQNFSTGDELFLYTWPENVDANHILMKWDLSSVAGTVPTSATLRLYMTGYGGAGGDNTYLATVHRVTGVDPTVSAASWSYYDGTNAWTGGADGGADDIGASEASFSVDKTPKYYSVDVTDMVKAWLLVPSANKGMMILPPETASVDTNRHFASSENPTAAFQPVLFLSYVPEPSPIKSLTGGVLTGGWIQ